MSLFGDFFKKDVTAYPSGRDVATGKETRAKWSEEKKMSVLMAGCLSTMLVCAVGGTTLACMQENHMHDYDKSLLATIDSVAATGIPMENAVEKGKKEIDLILFEATSSSCFLFKPSLNC